jgi:small-conductance mechanosensitive channel
MELIDTLTDSLVWASLVSLLLLAAGFVAAGFLARKSMLLKPIGAGLKLVVLFLAVRLFLFLGAGQLHPQFARHLSFYSWLVFAFAVLRLGLYVYGDLFVVRRKRGSFPAALKNIITAFVLVVVALVLLKEILNINVTSLIATTTVLTATIGLAFQSTLANMLAGLTIHLEKPLRQGDWISVAGYEGHVLDITLRSTRVKTIDSNEVFIPNSKVLSEAVVNYSLPGPVSIRKLAIGVAYSIPPNTVKDAVLDVLSAVSGVPNHPPAMVRVTGYGDFSVQYEIRYPVRDFSRYVEIESEIMNLLWYRFKRANIEIPFPVRNVNLTQITPESIKAERERTAAGILNLMERVDILAPLSPEELGKLVESVRVQSYAAGEYPVRQGEEGGSFYIIKRGSVDVLVEKPSGESAVVATLGAGNFFGEMSLLTGAVRTASIRVKDDADFILIDRESFRSVIVNNPSIAESLSHILSERQAGLEAQRERLDSSALERRKKEASGRLLKNIREFFGIQMKEGGRMGRWEGGKD